MILHAFREILSANALPSRGSAILEEEEVSGKVEGKRIPGSSWLSKGKAAMFLVAILAIVVPGIVEGARPERSVSGGSSCREPVSRDGIVTFTNEARATEGLPTLAENHLLDAIAETRARDMIEKQYFAHVSPTGETAAIVAQRMGYRYRVIAENIASGAFADNRKVVEAWMQSPRHRKNVLSSRVRELGASVVDGTMNGARVVVCVQVFGLQQQRASERTVSTACLEEPGTIETGEAALEAVGERLQCTKSGLDNEKSSIERDTRILAGDPRRNGELNSRIRAYNGKVDQYNRSLTGMIAMRHALDRTMGETGKRNTVTASADTPTRSVSEETPSVLRGSWQ
jgi:uncharacterized protein YkwD